MSQEAEPRYIPAARWRVFSRLYDPILALTMREGHFRRAMLERVDADLPEGGTALDLGCGTGTFALALAKGRPDAEVIGIDGDAEILGIAKGKPGASAIRWQEGLAQEVPAEDASADVVTISLVLHHLLPEDKRRALAEIRRVLKPGGRLHIADWGRPADPLMSAVFYIVQAIDGFAYTADHRAGRLPAFVEEAGFEAPERYGSLRTGFGSLELLRAKVAVAGAQL
ncbi:MAG TPA: methyltransferase domain-containing protein [Solirubrobacterales bacterium]|nr:methyltransferase domain-containing protein [Solirubrobacterales bacterium]